MELSEIISRLEKASGISEISEVRTFVGEYKGVGKVEIKIHDRGPGEINSRFHITAAPLDSAIEPIFITGNSESALDAAISTTHWSGLEKMNR